MDILREGFPKSVIDQADAAAHLKPISKLSRRNDLRSKTVFTFTDTAETPAELAFSLNRDENGWVLGVHVSDIDEYVCEGSPLDIEAKKRVATIANDFEVSKMLPDRIWKDVCNLLKDKERLAVSVILDISNEGELRTVSVEESVIRVSENFIYSEVDKFAMTADSSAIMSLRSKYGQYSDTILDMFELAAILCNKRRKRGGLNCAHFSRVYERNAEGKISLFERVDEPDTRAMVREVGYFTAEAVGQYMLKKKLPCVFCGRGNVPEESLDYLSRYVGADGRIKDPAKRAADIADRAKGKKYYDFVCDAIASAMPTSTYSSKRIQNSLCASDHIVSFFCPATRYTDLLVQRVLKLGIRAGSPENLNTNRFKKIITEVCDQINVAVQAMRETQKKYVRRSAYEYVANNVDNVFRGTPVSRLDNGGLIVILECALYATVPPKFASEIDFENEIKHYNFELLQLGGLNDQVLIKPISK